MPLTSYLQNNNLYFSGTSKTSALVILKRACVVYPKTFSLYFENFLAIGRISCNRTCLTDMWYERSGSTCIGPGNCHG